jgi:hypothetical protein
MAGSWLLKSFLFSLEAEVFWQDDSNWSSLLIDIYLSSSLRDCLTAEAYIEPIGLWTSVNCPFLLFQSIWIFLLLKSDSSLKSPYGILGLITSLSFFFPASVFLLPGF